MADGEFRWETEAAEECQERPSPGAQGAGGVERRAPYAAGAMSMRCSACGNRTRFDVVETVRRRRFHHYTLAGDLHIDEEEVLERSVEQVTCRWCERSDTVEELADP